MLARTEQSVSVAEVFARLERMYGEIIGPKNLWKELGYSSAAAARTARRRGQFPVEVFAIKNRRGFYAKTREVAGWLASIQANA